MPSSIINGESAGSGGSASLRRDAGSAPRPSLAPRLLSGSVLSALTVAAVWVGGAFLGGLLLLLLLVAQGELYRMVKRRGVRVLTVLGLAAGAVLGVTGVLDAGPRPEPLLAAIALLALGQTLWPPIEGRIAGLAWTVFGVAYVPFLGVHAWRLRELAHGREFLLLVLLAVMAADTVAFFVGSRWGRRRLAPHISPHKTWEGFLGGVAGTTVVVGVAARLLMPDASWGAGAAAGLLLGVVCPAGDLLESVIKRNLDAKDASRLIPGHGGVLDRIDSALIAAPFAFYVFPLLFP